MKVKSQAQYALLWSELQRKERGLPSLVKETAEQIREALEGVSRDSLPERVTPTNPEVEIVNKYGNWLKVKYKPYQQLAQITGLGRRGGYMELNISRAGLEELRAWLNATLDGLPERAKPTKRTKAN